MTVYLPLYTVTLLSSAVILVICKSCDLQAITVLSLPFWPSDCSCCLIVLVSARSIVSSWSSAGRCPCSWFCLFIFIIFWTFQCPGNFKCTKSYKNNTQFSHALHQDAPVVNIWPHLLCRSLYIYSSVWFLFAFHDHSWFCRKCIYNVFAVPQPSSSAGRGSATHSTKQLFNTIRVCMNSTQFWNYLEKALRSTCCVQSYKTAPLWFQALVVSLGCHLCFWLTGYRLEVPTTLRFWLTERRETSHSIPGSL